MELWYAGIDLSDIQTKNIGAQPVRDIADNAKMFVKYNIEVVCLVNSAVPASVRPDAPDGTPGDRLGVALPRLLEILTMSRQKLYCRIGNDLIIESPQRFPDGSEMECDVKNGPFTDARVLQIINDTSAYVLFKVETWLSDDNNFILSNVWACQNDIDDCGYTTRTLRGRAVIRSDFANHFNLTADNFRPFLFVPCDKPLRRAKIFVDVSEDGNTIDYAVVDQETTYGTGANDGKNSPVLRIEGNCTAGSSVPVKSMKGAINTIGPAVWGLWNGTTTPTGIVQLLWQNVVPVSTASALVKVTGRKGALGSVLANVALHAAAAKFGGGWLKGSAIVVSAQVTQPLGSEDEPWVEVRLEFLGQILNLAFLFRPSVVFDMMKLDVVGVPTYSMNPTSDTPTLGGSNNSRGSYVKSMVLQSLTPDGERPGIPGAPDALPDLSAYI